MADVFETWFKSEARPLLEGNAMTIDAWDEDVDTTAAAWTILSFVQKKIEARIKELRERLLEDAEADGIKTDKEGYRLVLQETELIRERREAKLPDEEELKKHLDANGIPVLSVFTEQKVFVIDPSKLANLIFVGKLDQKKIDKMKKENWALKGNPGKHYASILESWEEQNSAEDPEPIVETKRPKRDKAEGARKKK